jgi:hypothetical protein
MEFGFVIQRAADNDLSLGLVDFFDCGKLARPDLWRGL